MVGATGRLRAPGTPLPSASPVTPIRAAPSSRQKRSARVVVGSTLAPPAFVVFTVDGDENDENDENDGTPRCVGRGDVWGARHLYLVASGAGGRLGRMGTRRRGRGRGRGNVRRRWRWRSRRSFRGVVRVARRRARRARRDAVRRGRRGGIAATKETAKETTIQSSSRRGDGDGDVGAGGISRTSISPRRRRRSRALASSWWGWAARRRRTGGTRRDCRFAECDRRPSRGDFTRDVRGEDVRFESRARVRIRVASTETEAVLRVPRRTFLFSFSFDDDEDGGVDAGGAVCAKNSAVHAVLIPARPLPAPASTSTSCSARFARWAITWIGGWIASRRRCRRTIAAFAPPRRRQATGRAIERETEREVTRGESTPFASRRVVETRNLRERFFTVHLLARDESYANRGVFFCTTKVV